MNSSLAIKSHLLAITADSFRANGISAPVVSVDEFRRMLDRHDWNWDKAESRSDWISGLDNEHSLDRIADSSPELRVLFDQYEKEASK